MSVRVPRGKVHFSVARGTSQNLIDRADAFKKVRPVKRRRQPHAGDDIAHRDAHGRLLLMLGMHQVVGGGALSGQAFIQPQQHGSHLGVQVTEPLNKLYGKRGVQRAVLKPTQGRGR